MEEIEFCKCEKSSSIYTEFNDFYQWDVCSDCDKPIEDTIESLDNNDDIIID